MKHLPINLENYEEFFLLYVDNELTEGERKDVEIFAEQHPELKDELMMFTDTKLNPEDIVMDRKDELLRTPDRSAVSSTNYEELQLSWLDDELDEKEKNAIECFTNEHAEARANFEWLKKAKLPEEHIAYPDKTLLYRSMEKPAAVISIKWYRIAVAAAILIAAGLWFINRPDEEEISADQVTVAQKLQKEKNGDRQNSSKDSGKTTPSVTENNLTTGLEGNATNNEGTSDKNNSVNVSKINRSQNSNAGITRNEKNVLSIERQKENSNTTIDYAGSNKEVNAKTSTVISGQVEKITQKNIVDVAGVATDPMAISSALKTQPAKAINVKTDYATEALLQENNEVIADLQVPEEGRSRKGMFRGITRKASRIYNKVTNPDPDKAIVKVANFEIGLPR